LLDYAAGLLNRKRTVWAAYRLRRRWWHVLPINRIEITCIAVILGLVQPAGAQLMDHFNPVSANTNGVHLYGASIAGTYSTGPGAGTELGLPVAPQVSNNNSITMLQGSATFGLVRSIAKSSLSITYTPSYVRGVRSANFASFNHALSMAMGKNLSPKWGLSGSINGVMTDFNQLLFAQSRSADIALIPATFDEFAAALLTGTSSNLALTQAVNASPVIGSPETAFLYGGRMYSVAATGSAAYAYSSRSTFSMSISAGRTQFFSRGSNLSDGSGVRGFSVPWTTNGSASLSWGYSLTPRTTIGANLTTARTVSQFQDAYASQAGVSIGRTMSTRWFLHGTLGTGWIKPLRQTFQPTQVPQVTYGGGIGYKLYAHTFMASFTRSVSDVYGLGASATESSSGAWAWKRPGRSISVTSSFGYSRLINTVIPDTRSWTGLISAGKALNDQIAIGASYSYFRLPTSIVIAASDLTRSGVIVSLSWSPSSRR
jgi:hypothetical protein